MIPPHYEKWIKEHCQLLAIDNSSYFLMLKKLWPHFEKHGIQPGELQAATERFIHRPDQAADAWGAHFGHLWGHVRELRKESEVKAAYAKRKQEEARWKKEGNKEPIGNSDAARLLAGKLSVR